MNEPPLSPLIILLLAPLAGVLAISLGAPARISAIVSAAVNLAAFLFIAALYSTQTGGYQFTSNFPVSPDLGISLALGADGFSLLMLALSSVVTLCATLVARTPEKSPALFYSCLLLISTGAIGAFISTDILFFYIFHELALVPTFLLIGIYGSGDRQQAAWKITIYLALGSFILLVGLIGLYLSLPEAVRTFDMRQIVSLAKLGEINPPDWVFLLIFLGFGVLVSLFPFHTWAPSAYASAPSPAAMLHAGVLKKFGLYGILRIVCPVFPDFVFERWSWLILTMTAGSIFYVGFVTISQRKLDLMLGYSSVMHMGYAFLGILALNSPGLNGAGMTILAHGLTIAALFALCGELREKTGTLDFAELGGIAKSAPHMGMLFGFAAMASVGLPGFAGFAAELMVFFGAFSSRLSNLSAWSPIQMVTVLAVWGVVVSAVYMLRAYRKIFFGESQAKWESISDIGPLVRFSVTLIIVLLLVFGFWPPFALQYLSPSLIMP